MAHVCMSMGLPDFCYDKNFCIPDFFFLRFLVFELLSISYFKVVNSDLELRRLAGKLRSVVLQNMPLMLTCSD